jgi:hypothetical protein
VAFLPSLFASDKNGAFGGYAPGGFVAIVAPVPGRTRPIDLGADDERSYQEDRKQRGGIPGGYGGGVKEALSSGAALVTTKSCEVAEVCPLGLTKRH